MTTKLHNQLRVRMGLPSCIDFSPFPRIPGAAEATFFCKRLNRTKTSP